MESLQQLSRLRSQIVEQIGALGPMRMGTVSEQMLATRRSDGSVYRRGPYSTYTFKTGRKTRSKHLRSPEEVALYRQQIDVFRRYRELSAELVRVSQRLADLEAAQDRAGKKNSRR